LSGRSHLRRSGGTPQGILSDSEDYDEIVAALRAKLDESTLAAAWAEGRAMTPEQVVAYALNKTSASGTKDA